MFSLINVILATQSIAHSGGTDANGCHAGSKPYHCHGGSSNTWSDWQPDTSPYTSPDSSATIADIPNDPDSPIPPWVAFGAAGLAYAIRSEETGDQRKEKGHYSPLNFAIFWFIGSLFLIPLYNAIF